MDPVGRAVRTSAGQVGKAGFRPTSVWRVPQGTETAVVWTGCQVNASIKKPGVSDTRGASFWGVYGGFQPSG
jgi:hypothetical protein